MLPSLSDIDAQLAALGPEPKQVHALVDRYGGRGLSLLEADEALHALASFGNGNTLREAMPAPAAATPKAGDTSTNASASKTKSAPGPQPEPKAKSISRAVTVPAAEPAAKARTASRVATAPIEEPAPKAKKTAPIEEPAAKARTASRVATAPIEEPAPKAKRTASRTATVPAAEPMSQAAVESRVPTAPIAELSPHARTTSRAAAHYDAASLDADTTIAPLNADFVAADPEGTYPDVSVGPAPSRDDDGTVTNVFTSMAAAMVPKRRGSAPVATNLRDDAQPDPEGTYPQVMVDRAPERDADGTVTSVFTSMAAAAMVPKRSSASAAPKRTASAPVPVPAPAGAVAAEDEEEELLDEDFEELFEGEIELLE